MVTFFQVFYSFLPFFFFSSYSFPFVEPFFSSRKLSKHMIFLTLKKNRTATCQIPGNGLNPVEFTQKHTVKTLRPSGHRDLSFSDNTPAMVGGQVLWSLKWKSGRRTNKNRQVSKQHILVPVLLSFRPMSSPRDNMGLRRDSGKRLVPKCWLQIKTHLRGPKGGGYLRGTQGKRTYEAITHCLSCSVLCLHGYNIGVLQQWLQFLGVIRIHSYSICKHENYTPQVLKISDSQKWM